ncbi:hypothetical protein XFLAVUS301_40130 [Xanthobacter flavus]|uniref:Uncharacterized protein n=1 Tax=Xanthobacter flavus TaxID=281 RepID=A0A9W6CS33_XANFL|nr:hypothetical protein XFLAVUS301_40130 [Xanthobacter flavus]
MRAEVLARAGRLLFQRGLEGERKIDLYARHGVRLSGRLRVNGPQEQIQGSEANGGVMAHRHPKRGHS